jgi:hypothetical protein
MSVETLRELATVPDGVKVIFETPTRYKAGTFRLVVNGLSYEEHDDRYGWVELNDLAVQINMPPRADDLLQAFYTDLDASELETLFAIGSPFGPGEGCP